MEKEEFLNIHEEFWDIYPKSNIKKDKLIRIEDYNFLESVEAKFYPIPSDVKDFFIKFNNEINDFYLGIFKIQAWAKMLEGKSIDNKTLILSYLNPLAQSLLSYPYIFKNRIAFCLTNLLHDLGKIFIENYNHSFNKCSINVSTITGEGYDSCKGRYLNLAKELNINLSPITGALNDINAEKIKEFRHAWNHRFPKNIELGYSKHSARIENNGKVVYGFGGGKPLKVSKAENENDENLIELLLNEHNKILEAFDKYWAVNLQIFELITT
jgi:hypothetical protein